MLAYKARYTVKLSTPALDPHAALHWFKNPDYADPFLKLILHLTRCCMSVFANYRNLTGSKLGVSLFNYCYIIRINIIIY